MLTPSYDTPQHALNPQDPAKYDYALFGIGVNEEEIPDEFVVNPQFLK